MNCPECNKEKNSHFDKEAIRLLKRCVDCKIKWEARPENDPDNNRYEIDYHYGGEGSVTIYAPSKEEAKDMFYNEDYGEGEECEIDGITETTREELNERFAKAHREQVQKSMGEPAI